MQKYLCHDVYFKENGSVFKYSITDFTCQTANSIGILYYLLWNGNLQTYGMFFILINYYFMNYWFSHILYQYEKSKLKTMANQKKIFFGILIILLSKVHLYKI